MTTVQSDILLSCFLNSSLSVACHLLAQHILFHSCSVQYCFSNMLNWSCLNPCLIPITPKLSLDYAYYRARTEIMNIKSTSVSFASFLNSCPAAFFCLLGCLSVWPCLYYISHAEQPDSTHICVRHLFTNCVVVALALIFFSGISDASHCHYFPATTTLFSPSLTPQSVSICCHGNCA